MNKTLFAALTPQDRAEALTDKHFQDLEGRNAAGLTPLEYAIGVGAMKCAEALLANKAKPELSAVALAKLKKKTPITDALHAKATQVARALIDAGAPLVEDGDHILHIAATRSGGSRVIAYLVDAKGLDVDLISKGRTPLQVAMHGIGMPSLKTVEALVSRGANVMLRPSASKPLIKDLYAHHANSTIKDLKALHVALNTPPNARKAKPAAAAKPVDRHAPRAGAGHRTAASAELIAPYVKRAVTAKLDGKLFAHVPATFHFFFQPAKPLRAALREAYEDETQDWSWDELVPVAAVSFDAKRANAFAWLFLDWRGDKKAPSVVVTTTDRWDDSVGVKSLAALRLKIG